MPLNLDEKKAIVAEVSSVASTALSAATAKYRGLTVSEVDALRAQAREKGVYLRVVKNTLAKRAVSNTEFECLTDTLAGPLIFGFSKEEPGAVGRLFKDFAKEHDKFEVHSLAVGGQAMGADKLDVLAKLPTKDEAIARLMSVMQAPITKFVRTVAEPTAKMVRTFAAVRDQKQQ